MKLLSTLLVSALSITTFACGDSGSSGSDIPDSTKLNAISQNDAESLCYEMVDLWPERNVTCSGQTFKLGLTDADCDNGTEDPTAVDPSCTATVGDARACLRAFAALTDAQICSGTAPSACAAVNACSDEEARVSSPAATVMRAQAILSRN